MTKCIVISEANHLKPIEFTHLLHVNRTIEATNDKPSDFSIIELICKNYSSNFDLMFAMRGEDHSAGNRSSGTLYFGKWNDGIAEVNKEKGLDFIIDDYKESDVIIDDYKESDEQPTCSCCKSTDVLVLQRGLKVFMKCDTCGEVIQLTPR